MIVKTYSHVVEFSIPSSDLLATVSRMPVLNAETILTVRDYKKIDAQDSEALANFIVRVLELALHHCSIYLDDDNASQSSEYHRSTAPLISKEFCCDSVRDECTSSVYASKSEDGGRVDAERFVQDSLIVLDDIDARQGSHCLDSDRDQRSVSVQAENLFDGFDLAHHLVFDLSPHECELFVQLMSS